MLNDYYFNSIFLWLLKAKRSSGYKHSNPMPIKHIQNPLFCFMWFHPLLDRGLWGMSNIYVERDYASRLFPSIHPLPAIYIPQISHSIQVGSSQGS